jgi:diguanylate cyclase (GGDEF)-like protein
LKSATGLWAVVLFCVALLYLTIGYFFHILSKKDRIILKKNEELKILATHDSLTKVHNRLMFDEYLQHSIDKRIPFILALFDIDFFKNINDQYGHDVGDSVLKELTSHITHSLRRDDTLFRVGGEEFTLVFEKMELENALKVIERLRKEIENKVFAHGIHITVSFGVVCSEQSEYRNLYKHADIALYEAKKSGRNKVVLYSLARS